jgi:hypothetical protein
LDQGFRPGDAMTKERVRKRGELRRLFIVPGTG